MPDKYYDQRLPQNLTQQSPRAAKSKMTANSFERIPEKRDIQSIYKLFLLTNSILSG